MATDALPLEPTEYQRYQRRALGVGAVGLVLCALAWVLQPAAFFRSYLWAFNFFLGIALGCLVLVASGVSYRKHEAPGFAELTGAGIYYGAAVTEARACSDQRVVIIGGANSAGQAAVFFSAHARTITILVRGASLEDAKSQYLAEQLHVVGDRHLADVTAGREVPARTADDDDGRLGGQPPQAGLEVVGQGDGDGVHGLRPVQGQPPDPPVERGEDDRLVRHAGPL